jgi:AraC family transcriptional regulator of adaptative response/methylated-DNA-[protein]-cysteine methyltransferase
MSPSNPQAIRMHAVSTANRDPLERIRRRLDSDEAPPRLVDMARDARVSPATLLRRFRQRYGLTPSAYVRARRERALRGHLRAGRDVTSAIYDAGFGAPSRVYESARATLGMTPAAYRRGAPELAIRYTTVASPLGALLVATTDRGICQVALGDDEARLVEALTAEFPRARCERVDAGADEWIGAVVARVAGELGLDRAGAAKAAAELPLDVRASAFQWRVWRELMRIPRGETRSYSEIAQALGQPRAVRAVASACASNRLALIVPCHRVIRADGSLGGYRWGIPRKAALLESEGAAAG